MENYKAIVFDMDGNVLYTLDELTKSLNYVFARHGLPALPLVAFHSFGIQRFPLVRPTLVCRI